MRLPQTLLAALKAQAKQRGIPYQRLIREALEQALTHPSQVKRFLELSRGRIANF